MESKLNDNYYNLVAWETSDGQFHRLDGPAVIWHPHKKLEENIIRRQWWINGNPVTEIIIPWAEDMGIDLENLSEDDRFLIVLKWGEYGK